MFSCRLCAVVNLSQSNYMHQTVTDYWRMFHVDVYFSHSVIQIPNTHYARILTFSCLFRLVVSPRENTEIWLRGWEGADRRIELSWGWSQTCVETRWGRRGSRTRARWGSSWESAVQGAGIQNRATWDSGRDRREYRLLFAEEKRNSNYKNTVVQKSATETLNVTHRKQSLWSGGVLRQEVGMWCGTGWWWWWLAADSTPVIKHTHTQKRKERQPVRQKRRVWQW